MGRNHRNDVAGVKLPDSLYIVLLLFPGFLSERVASYLSTSPPLGDLELIASALAATLFNVTVAVGVVWLLRRGRPGLGLVAHGGFLAAVLLISVLSGIGWAVLDSNNVVFALHLTERASRAEPWETVFQANAASDRPYFVRVVTKAGGIYHGQPLYYSQSGSDKALVLDLARREIPTNTNAGVVTKCEYVGLDVHGRVLVPSDQIIAVEFRPKTLGPDGCSYHCEITPSSRECSAPK